MIELIKRGTSVNLQKDNPNVNLFNIALSWGEQRYDQRHPFDLDVSVFLLSSSGLCRDDRDIVFYGQLKHESGAVEHSGDERTGASAGDDEVIRVDLSKIPAGIERIVGVVSIYDWNARKQNFGQVSGASARVDNGETGEQLYKYNLEDDFSTQTGVKLFEFKKVDGSWRFKAIGEGYNAGLGGFVKEYGLVIKGLDI
ncbi:General stress protein 16U [compost metagenome]